MTQYLTIILISALVMLSLLATVAITFLVIQKNKNKELIERVTNLDEAANESYVKFITDSRNWAYEYIEEVQDKLSIFASKVEPQLDYFNTYGKSTTSPHTIILEEIDSAYKDLKSVLPEENKEK